VGQGNGIQSWGFILDNGSANNSLGRPCCASLPGSIGQHQKPLAFYIWQEAPITDTVRAWIGWLLGPQTPWIELVKAQPEQDFEFILKHGWVMTNLEFPTNYIVTFMKAWRQALEFAPRVTVWHEAVKLGAHPSVAGYLTDIATLNGNNVTLYGGTGHGWAEPYNAALDGLTNIINQKYVKEHASPHNFIESRQYYPCDHVWGYASGHYNHNILRPGSKSLYQMATEYQRQCGKDLKGARRFSASRSEEQARSLTIQQWVDFCKKLHEEATK
jgi:hypothetical protein